MAACVLAPTFASAAAPQTKADHIAQAEKYDKMAAEQEAVAQEHTEMLKDYKANSHRYPKQVREKWIAQMRKHCTAIIRTSKQLAKEYQDMAKWHRMVADNLVDEK